MTDRMLTRSEMKLPVWERRMNPEQLEAINHQDGPVRMIATPGCHRVGQLVLMYDGTRKAVEDIIVGDVLMGPDSRPRRVQSLHRGRDRMVEICPVKGSPFVVNEGHILTLIRSHDQEVRDVEVSELVRLPNPSDWKLFRVGVEFPYPTKLPIDPYFLGVLLGDGTLKNGIGVSKPDREIIDEVFAQAKRWGLLVRRDGEGTTAVYMLSSGSAKGKAKVGRNRLTNVIRSLGLYGTTSGTKFIPSIYMTSSRKDRLRLLAGLIDTDGSLSTNTYDYISKSRALSEGLAYVARSVGLAAYVVSCEKWDQHGTRGTYYRVSISGNTNEVPCRIPRKIAQVRGQIKNVLCTGFSRNFLGVEDYYGFELDGDGRYLLDDFTVTHNSGKTRCVVHRIARMVMQGIPPERLLAVTFSKKAADEMESRVEALGVCGVRVATWHSLCLQILREDKTEWAEWEVDKRIRAKGILKMLLGYKGMNWTGADLHKVQSFISKCKVQLFAPDSEEATKFAREEFGHHGPQATKAFHLFNEALAEKQIITFDDFMVFVDEHFKDENNRAKWAQRWDYIIQDECQDESPAQGKIATMLAQDHRNYMVVGDPRQSIFKFMASSPKRLVEFDKHWPDTKTVVVNRNYRSGRKIIQAANNIISFAKDYSGEMIAERDLDGEVHIQVNEDLDDEAKNFAAWVKNLAQGGVALSDTVALFRTNAQSRALEEALLASRIPYVVVGGISFYERKEVRDLLAYLRVAANEGEPQDIQRCINAPFRFLGAKFVEKVMDVADDWEQHSGLNWPTIVSQVADGEKIQSRQKASAEEWANMIRHIDETIVDATRDNASSEQKAAAKPSVILDDIIRKTRYIDYIVKEEGEESLETSGAANVREMVRVAERFSTVKELLDYIAKTIKAAEIQRRDKQAGGERVLLMSCHRVKGLEYPYVWVAGFNEMILPHVKGDPEEERRLAYVAVTRARDHLVLSHVRTLATRAGIKDAQPSRFLADAKVSNQPDVTVDVTADTQPVPSLESVGCQVEKEIEQVP